MTASSSMRTLIPALLLFSGFLLSSCSASRLISSWKDDSLGQYHLGKVLVVGITSDETKRRIYEDSFVSGLSESGVLAVPSYTISKHSAEADEKSLRETLAKSQATSVLITHMVDHEKSAFYQPSSTPIGTHGYYGNTLFGYYPLVWRSIPSSGSYVDTIKVMLETNLYDVKSENLLWSARSESTDPVMTRKYYRELIDLFLSDLKKSNVL